MRFQRSTKCSTKFATAKKREELRCVLREYGKVVNIFIDYFWNKPKEELNKSKLLKDIVDIPNNTWLSARLRKVAAREAIDMVLAVRERWKDKPGKAGKPVHAGRRMHVSSTIAELTDTPERHFDSFLVLRSIGNKIAIDIPIQKHEHFHKWNSRGTRNNDYIITENYVQFSFEIITEAKKEEGTVVGIDTGIKTLGYCSNGVKVGEKIESILNQISRCKHGSKHQIRLRNYLRHYINFSAKEVFKKNPNLQTLVVERLKEINFKSKVRRKVGKKTRKNIGNWNYRQWLQRLEFNCEENCVRFVSINPSFTSQCCNHCGHTDKTNRLSQDTFRCVQCGHTDHADSNAAKNILNRGISAVYRRGFKL